MDEKELINIEQCYEGRGTISMHKIPRMVEHIYKLIAAVRTLNEENARLTGRVEKLTQLSEFIGTKKL